MKRTLLLIEINISTLGELDFYKEYRTWIYNKEWYSYTFTFSDYEKFLKIVSAKIEKSNEKNVITN